MKAFHIKPVAIIFTVNVVAGNLLGQMHRDLVGHTSFARIGGEQVLVTLHKCVKGSIQDTLNLGLIQCPVS
jgi:hypothetical protein